MEDFENKLKKLSRRDFLKSTGAGIAALGVTAYAGNTIARMTSRDPETNRNTNQSPTGMATGGNYDPITVDAGDTFTKTMSDGETWENKLIDITASGASYKITAQANNWEIRNIGIRGQLDSTPGTQNFVVQVPDPNATGLIENVYIPGTSYPRSTSPFPSGFYIHYNHAGDLEVNNYYAENLPSHGIYGSDPGNRNNNGKEGTVRIHNSYAADTAGSGFRIGTDGSYVENCVAFRTLRGVWSRWANTEIRDSDLGDNTVDIVVGQSGYDQSSTVTVKNTRYGDATEANGTLHGSSAGTPQERIPEGCPTSAKEAASGTGSSGTGPRSIASGPGPHTVVVSGGSPNNPLNYIIEADNIQKEQGNGKIIGNVATGILTGGTHQYRYEGQLYDFVAEDGITVEFNDEEVTRSEIRALCQT